MLKQKPTKKIVILGAGFCGVRAAKNLSKFLHGRADYEIILVNRHNYQIYQTDLYEVSTAYNPRLTETCLADLKNSVGLSLEKIFADCPNVKLVIDEISKIEIDKNRVATKKTGVIDYDYLVIGLGSVVNYYNIPGLKEHAFSLKTIDEAVKIDCRLDELLKQASNSSIQIAIGGGGFSGVELASELIGYLKKLSKKYGFNLKNKVKVLIIEAGQTLLNCPDKLSKQVEARLKELGIRILLNSKICAYDGQTVSICRTDNTCQKTEKVAMLIWTGGIAPSPLLKDFKNFDERFGLKVSDELVYEPNIYAGGDSAAIYDTKTGRYLPKLAQLAIPEGDLIADNIWADILGEKRKKFKPRFKGMLVPLGGKYALYNRGSIKIFGFGPFILRKLVDLIYFINVLPVWSGFKKWIKGNRVFMRND